MGYELEIIEDAIVEALSSLKTSGVRTVEAYAGQVESAQELSDVAARLPAVWVSGESLTVEQVNRVDRVSVVITIIVADRNVRGPSASLTGHSGVFSILEAVRVLLNRKRLLAGWSALKWTKDESIVVGPRNSLSIFSSQYTTTLHT